MTPISGNAIYYDGAWYYVSPGGSKHIITRSILFANVNHDICLVAGDGPDEIKLAKLGEAKARKDKILNVPLGDILWLNLSPPYSGNMSSMVLDISSDQKNTKPLLRKMLETGALEHPKKG